jgi:hypothetical protein
MGTNEENGESLIVTDELLVRYLLGELQETDRIRIQERSFSDDDLFERLLEAENDLIDRYARGELARDERRLFEKVVLPRESTRQRLTFAGALGAVTGSGQPASAVGSSQGPTRQYVASRAKKVWYGLAAAGLLVALGVVVWLALPHSQQALRKETAQSQAPSQQQPSAAPINPSAGFKGNTESRPEPESPGANRGDQSGREAGHDRTLQTGVATFVLLPGSTRSTDQNQELTIKSGTREVALRLQLDEADEYKSYGVILRTAGGNEIWRRSGLVPGRFPFGKAVTVQATARSLVPGQYELELTGRPGTGAEALVNYYYFTVRIAI